MRPRPVMARGDVGQRATPVVHEQHQRFQQVTTPVIYLNASDDEVFSDWSAAQ